VSGSNIILENPSNKIVIEAEGYKGMYSSKDSSEIRALPL
jgi:hypothetical protein